MLARWLVAGGSLMGVIFCLSWRKNVANAAGMEKISLQSWLSERPSENDYFLLGAFLFGLIGWMLYKTAMKKSEIEME